MLNRYQEYQKKWIKDIQVYQKMRNKKTKKVFDGYPYPDPEHSQATLGKKQKEEDLNNYRKKIEEQKLKSKSKSSSSEDSFLPPESPKGIFLRFYHFNQKWYLPKYHISLPCWSEVKVMTYLPIN